MTISNQVTRTKNRSSAAILMAAAILTALIALMVMGPTSTNAQTTVTLISNTGQSNSTEGTIRGADRSQQFTTGGNSQGYRLTSVDIDFSSICSGTCTEPTYTVEIYSNTGSNTPDASLGILTNPTLAGKTNTFNTTGEGIYLAASTSYFVVIDTSASGTGTYNVWFTSSDEEDSGGAPNWSIRNTSLSKGISATSWASLDVAMQMNIKGYAMTASASADATLSALSLGTGVTLTPALASDTTEYRAWVENSVSSVTVTATETHSSAAVAIAGDTDPSTPNTATLSLQPGLNIITLTVTAEDTSTKTYTVATVREAAAPTQDPNALLTANLTVDSDGPRHGYLYIRLGHMTKNNFQIDGTTYRLSSVYIFGDTARGTFGAHTVAVCFRASGNPENNVRNTLIISIDGHTFSFDTATRIGSLNCFEWDRPTDLSWTYGDVSLVKVTGSILVSNLRESYSTDIHANLQLAQGFTTGSAAQGYKLKSAALHINKPASSTRSLRVRFHSDNGSGRPGDRLFTFIGPESLSSGIYTLRVTAPSGTRLSPNQTYHLVAQQFGGAGLNITLQYTGSEDENGAPGWSIANRSYYWNNHAWVTPTGQIRVEITGSPAPNNPYVTATALKDAPTDGLGYETGDTITISTTFSEAVDVTGTPRLPISIGGVTRQATYSASRESNTVLDFTYTVQSSDFDSSGFEIPSNQSDLNGGTIKRTGTRFKADLDKPLLVTRQVVNTAVITEIAVVSDTPGYKLYSTGDDIEFRVTFSEAVEITGTPQLGFCLNNSGQDCNLKQADYNRGTGTSALVFRYTVQTGNEDDNGIWIGDNAITLNSGTISKQGTSQTASLRNSGISTQTSHRVYSGPIIHSVVVTSTPRYSADTYTLGEQIKITVTFSEAVVVTGDPQFRISIGPEAAAPYDSGSDTTMLVFAYTVQDGDADDSGIWIGNGDQTFSLDADDSIKQMNTDIDASLTHQQLGQLPSHKIKTADNPPKFAEEAFEFTIAQNTPAGTAVGAPLTATDADTGDTATYRLDGDDAADFTISSSTGQISTAGTYSFITKPTYSFTASVTDGVYTHTVTVTITIMDTDTMTADATLSALVVSPKDIAGFTPDHTTYHVGAASTTTQATVVATTTSPTATLLYSGNDRDLNAAGHQVNLSNGQNTVTITVTSQDTFATKVYTLRINRGVAADYGWKAVEDLDGLKVAGNHEPRGIWSNGATTWVSDWSGGKIYAYNTDGTRDSSNDFETLDDAENDNPQGIWSDNTTMWVADAADDKIYAYDLSTKAYDSSKDFNTLIGAGNRIPNGIWSDNTTMWVSDYGDSKIYAYRMSDKTRDSDKEFNTLDHAGNDEPRGIWSNGATMWVTDQSDGKIYAYWMRDKSRDPDNDFNTLNDAGSDRPRGIWSDRTTMWVADSFDDKIYSYNMPPRSDDATLSTLTVSPKDIIGFDSDRESYEVGLASTVTQATVTATSDPTATVDYSSTDADDMTDGHQVDLSAGKNSVTITVTAEDETTTQEYTVSINRGVTDDYGWKASDDVDALTAAGNRYPMGVWTNGTTMWVLDRIHKKIYAYDLSTKAQDTSKDFTTLDAAGNDSPRGIWSDGTTMWVGDLDDRKLYAYRMSDRERDTSKEFHGLIAATNEHTGDIWSDGTTMWVLDINDDKIYAYNMGTKNRDSAKDLALKKPLNQTPTGIWSDKRTMWVSDATAVKIFAYDLATNARKSSRDFTTLNDAGNGYQSGIYSDGTTMWVIERGSTQKIYSYNMPPSDDPNLSALSLSGVTLEPDFDTGTTTYTATVDNSVTSTDVTATTRAPVATTVLKLGGTEDTDTTVDLALGANIITVEVTAEDTTTETYTVTVTREAQVLSSDATLSALSLGTGVTLTPAFASDTTEYRAWVENATESVDVTATANDSNATVAITDDSDTSSTTTATINLAPGLNTIAITLTAQDSTTETYTVSTVREAAAPAQDPIALLTANVTVGEVRNAIGYFANLVPGWGAMTDTNFLVGTADPYTISSVLVMGEASASAYQANTVSVCFSAAQHPPADTRNTLTLGIGMHDFAFKDATVFPTVPTCYEWPRPAELTWSYGDVSLVKVTQQAPSDDATLSALTVTPGTVHGFAADRLSYQVGVASTVTRATVTATATDTDAEVAYSGTDASTTDTGHQVDLSEGRNEVTITVRAEDTTTTEEYTVSINRGTTDALGWKAADDFDSLIAAENEAPRGIWSNETTMWVADLQDDKIYAYNMATKARDTDKDFDTLDAATNNNPHGIWSDDTTMWVVDSTDEQIYAYNMDTKARDSAKDFATLTAADNKNPTGIWSDNTTMWVADERNKKIYAYKMSDRTRDADKDIDDLTFVPADIWSNGSTMWISNKDDETGGTLSAYQISTKARVTTKDFNTFSTVNTRGPFGMWSTDTTMWVSDLDYDKVFSFNMPAVSTDATLSALSLSGVTLEPAFATGTTTYTATVDNSVTSTEVTPTTSDPVATTVLKLGGTEDTDGTVDLALGANVITVEVTAEDTTTTETYTVTVTREARILSTDATLTALTVSPKDIIGFDTDRESYEVGVASTVNQATETATPTDTDATVGYSTTDASSDAGHQVDLSAGRNQLTITVTAEDGVTTQEYTIRINRGVATDYGWKASDDLDGLRAAGNVYPTGVWSNATTVWVSDDNDAKIYAYNRDGTHDSANDFTTLAALNVLPSGIWSNGTTMWVTDNASEKIYAYSTATKARDASKDFNTLEGAGNNNPLGIWSDGITMWVTDNIDDKIYAYDLATKARDSTKDFDTLLDAGNRNPAGIWSDGITMWVSDSFDGKIYAYRMSDKARVSSRDFTTLSSASNAKPRGIWSDGATMWVSDDDDDKVFSYNMPPSNDATLSALTVSPGTVHGFAADRLSYEVGVASTVTRVTITLATKHSGATIHPSSSVTSRPTGYQVNLLPGQNVATFAILAEDGISGEIYTVNINRGVATDYGWKAADDLDGFIAAELFGPSGLTSDGTNFWITTDNETGIYAFNYLGGRATNRDVGPTADNTNSAYLWTSETAIYALDTNDLKVYAYQLSDLERQTAKEFSLNSENADPAGIWSDETTVWIVDTVDNKLYAYALSGGARDADKDIALDADNTAPTGITSNGVTMWVADSDDEKIYAYTLSGTRQPTKEINALINAGNRAPKGLWSTADTLWVNDSDESKAYSYNIPMETPQQIISGDATLRALTLTGMILVPPFTPGTTSYTATVPNVIGSTRVTATPNHASATRVIKLGGDVDPDGVIFLAVGPNTITVEVTAEDETTTDTYTVTVTREAAALSEDATLRSLTVSPKDIIGFTPDRLSYEVGVASTVPQATVVATPTQSRASVELLPADADGNTPGHQVDLSAGKNTVNVTVTAEDSSTEEYTVNINRGVTDDFGWKAVEDLDGLVAAGNNSPSGIWSNGTTTWVTDQADTKIFAYNIATKQRDPSKDFDTLTSTGNIDPYDIWSDNTTMWVADLVHSKLFAYNLSTKAYDSSKDFNTLINAGNLFPTGIWSDTTTMWVVDNHDDKLYAYNIITKAHDSAKDITLEAQNDTPRGIWSDGTTMWVADKDNKKLYAYRMSDQARDSDRDFTTLGDAGNDDPRAIWSDGTTMWVADNADDKIYSYNMSLLPPGNLQAEIGDRRVTLTWNNPGRSSITGYQYRVSADDGSSWNPDWTAVPGSNARTTSHTVRNLANGISHTVQIRALEGSKKSEPAELTATPMGPPSAPPSPTNLVVDSRDGGLMFSWQKPRQDSRAPITSYDVRRRPYGSSSSWQNVSRTNDDNSTWQLVEGLTNRRAYEVQVAAVNRIGRGAWASGSAVPQGVQPPPRNPDDVLGQNRRLGELAAQWTDGYPSDAWHPDMDEFSTNLILNDCMGSTGFKMFWVRTESQEAPVEYEAHFITNEGAGFITHQFRTRLTGPDDTVLYGSVTLHKFSYLTVRARARYGDRWSRWTRPVGLYCITDEDLRTTQQQHEESLAQSEETPNSPPEGNVTIRGTAQTGVRLWAITSRITDPDGMESPGFTYQWLRDTGSGGAEIPNAFRSTYLLVDADVGSQVSVRVSFTDDAGNTETLTSDAVHVQEPPPLHGGFDAVPASHDGSNPFTFQIHFSVEPELTATNVRDHVLTVTNGAVTAASQTEPGSSTPNIRWQITVTPSGDDGVTVALPATTDCSADGAVCASDGRMLQNPSSITVSGPPEEEETEPPPPATTPGKPTGLTATLNSDGSITLSWNPPSGDTVDGYQILRRRPRENERSLTVYVEDTGNTATTYADTNTALDTRYVYRVKARNSAGLSPWSNYARVDK